MILNYIFQRDAQDKFIMCVDPTQDFFFLYSQPNNTDTLNIIGNEVQVNSNMLLNGEMKINTVAADPDIIFQTGGVDKFVVGVDHVASAFYVRRSGGSIALNVNTNGVVTKPVQPRTFVRWQQATVQPVAQVWQRLNPIEFFTM